MKVADLIQRAAKALERADLSSADAAALQTEVSTAAIELGERVVDIRPSIPGLHGSGRLRAQIAATGSDADMLALDREFEQLAPQAERLSIQRDQLNQRRQAALAREAAAGMPMTLASLADAVDALESAHRAVAEREQSVRHAYTQVSQARSLARNAGLPAAAGDVELARRMVRVMPDYQRHQDDAIGTVTGGAFSVAA